MNSGADPERVCIEIEKRADYRIMWLAGIRELDLTQHCLKTFTDCDKPRIDSRVRQQRLYLMADTPPVAWYLCALPIPWSWARNAHLAFEWAAGESWEGDALVPGLGVKLTNARPIFGWGEHSIPADAPGRSSLLYRTCRNWQFGWWLRANREVPDAAVPHPTMNDGGEQLMLDR
jgi:hypothetical protein